LAAFRSTTCLSRRRETAILREAAAGTEVAQTLRIATVDFAVGRKLPHAMNIRAPPTLPFSPFHGRTARCLGAGDIIDQFVN
jgi:hypothetical protein